MHITKGKVSLIDEWLELSELQKFNLWKERIELVINEVKDKSRRKILLNFDEHLTFENYKNKKTLERYFNDNHQQFTQYFSDDEIRFIFETFHPFIKDYETSMIELAKMLEKVKVNYQPQPNQWGGTFTCVCRNFCWEALLSCNEPSCNQTSDGCGFLWLYPCTFDCTLGGA